ncbi:MAG: hypothetical protein KC493_06235 [Bacteriovoracaceae bacterium]|nr:hypothetical protein [Bacteriovoracaceae bacterium]
MKAIYLVALFLFVSCAGYKTQFDSQSKSIEGQFWDDFEHLCLNQNMSAYKKSTYNNKDYHDNVTPAVPEEFSGHLHAEVKKIEEIKHKYNLVGPIVPPPSALRSDNRLSKEIKKTGSFRAAQGRLIQLDKRCYRSAENRQSCLEHLYSRRMTYPYRVSCKLKYKTMEKSNEKGRKALIEEFGKRYGPQALEVGRVVSSRSWTHVRWDDALIFLMRDNLSIFLIGFSEDFKTEIQLLTFSDSFPITKEKIMGKTEVLDLSPMGLEHVKGNMKVTLDYFNRISNRAARYAAKNWANMPTASSPDYGSGFKDALSYGRSTHKSILKNSYSNKYGSGSKPRISGKASKYSSSVSSAPVKASPIVRVKNLNTNAYYGVTKGSSGSAADPASSASSAGGAANANANKKSNAKHPMITCYKSGAESTKQLPLGKKYGLTANTKLIKNVPAICKFNSGPKRFFVPIYSIKIDVFPSCSDVVLNHSSISAAKEEWLSANKHCSFGNIL